MELETGSQKHHIKHPFDTTSAADIHRQFSSANNMLSAGPCEGL